MLQALEANPAVVGVLQRRTNLVLEEYSKNASRQKAGTAIRIAIYSSSEREKDG